MGFVDIDLLCNKLNVQLLANNSIIHIKKKYILEMEDEADKPLKAKVTQEKRTPVKQVQKKSLKILVYISGLISKLFLNI